LLHYTIISSSLIQIIRYSFDSFKKIVNIGADVVTDQRLCYSAIMVNANVGHWSTMYDSEVAASAAVYRPEFAFFVLGKML